MNPLHAFFVTLALVYVLLGLRKEPSKVLLLSALVFGFLSIPAGKLPQVTLESIVSHRTANVLLAFVLAFFLAGLLKEVGVLDAVTRAFARRGCDAAAVGIPALVGLVPMSGGALVSAMMLKDTFFESMRLDREKATYTNYWFRHVWVPSWPLYQAMIIAAAVLEVKTVRVAEATYPATIAAIIAGLLVYYLLVRRKSGSTGCEQSGGSLKALWPFAALAVLVVLLGLTVWEALLVTTLLASAIYKPGREQLKRAVRFALSPKLLVIVFGAMLFAGYIKASGAAAALYEAASASGLPSLAVAFFLPFSIGLVSSGEFIFSAVALPMLTSILGLGDALRNFPLLIAYLGGHMGTMLSPLHLCMVLTLHYYNANYVRVLPYVALSVALTVLLTLFFAGLL